MRHAIDPPAPQATHHAPDLLTLQEVAQILRLCKATVYRMVQDKTLQAHKVGRQWRIARKDLDALLKP